MENVGCTATKKGVRARSIVVDKFVNLPLFLFYIEYFPA